MVALQIASNDLTNADVSVEAFVDQVTTYVDFILRTKNVQHIKVCAR